MATAGVVPRLHLVLQPHYISIHFGFQDFGSHGEQRPRYAIYFEMGSNMSFNTLAQIGLTTFTVFGFLLTSLKLPEYGVLSFLLSQVFYLYAAYKAWKEANQLGLFITTVFVTITILIGVANYWIL